MDGKQAVNVIKSLKEDPPVTPGTPFPDGGKRRLQRRNIFKYKPEGMAEKTFEFINDFVSLSFGGYSQAAIADKMGVDQSYPKKLKERYPEAFAICEREVIRDVIPRIGLKLTGYKHALNALVPLALEKIESMINDESTSKRDMITLIGMVTKLVGLTNQEAIEKEDRRVGDNLTPYLENFAKSVGAEEE